MPNVTMYNVVKNNKTPSGPMSVGDVNSSISNKAASPAMLTIDIIWLCFIAVLYHKTGKPPSNIYVWEEWRGYPALIITTISRNPCSTFPFDRFTLGEALSLSSVSFRSVLCF